MSDKNDGDKTEQPTQKRLNDARKKGDVPKSKELTSTMTLLVWLGLGVAVLPMATQRLGALILKAIEGINTPFALAAPAMGWMAFEVAMLMTATLLVPIIIIGLLVEFLQAGPVWAMDKVKPKLDSMNPVAGMKKMFGKDNWIDVLKALVKAIVLLWVGWIVMKSLLPQILLLPTSSPASMGTAMWQVVFKLLSWSLAAFAALSVLDVIWQRQRFIKKNRMSMEDIKKEMKESDGDPHIKQHRKQLHHEWSQQASANAASRANVLVVNPTHVAIAIEYDRDTCPVPTLTAKGEEDVARAMREAAEEAGVPIVRNVPLAREMLVRIEEGEVIPADLFEIVAEVILWAKQVREDIARHEDPLAAPLADDKAGPRKAKRRAPPGEDMTRYPDDFLARQPSAGEAGKAPGADPS